MWDLYTKKEVATFQLGWCASASDLSKPPRYISHRFLCDCPGAQNVLHGAWGTIALDTRSAYELPLDEGMTASDFLDVSDQKKRFKVSETTSHQYHSNTDDEDSTDDEEIEVVGEADETDDDEEDIDPTQQLLGMTFEELAQSVSVVSTVSFAT